MIELRTPREIEEMRPAGRFVADVLLAVREAAGVGVNLLAVRSASSAASSSSAA